MLVDRINQVARKVPTWAVYIVCLIPVPVLLYMGMTGGLGREPIKALEHELGEIALQLLIIGLCITPLRRFAGVNLIKFRRAIGVSAFFFVLAHFLVFAILDVQSVSRVWNEIVKRPYVTVGMVSFLMMIPLAVTSNNLSVRKMGAAAWRKMHKLTYPAAILGAVHYLWLVKGFQLEPILYLLGIIGLVATRYVSLQRKRQVA